MKANQSSQAPVPDATLRRGLASRGRRPNPPAVPAQLRPAPNSGPRNRRCIGAAVWVGCLLVALAPTATAQSPQITSQPQDQTACAGTAVSFHVQAIGAPPLDFQWRRDGSNISLGVVSYPNESFLTLNNVQASDAASVFDVIVHNDFGFATSTGVVVRVSDPTIWTQPFDLLVTQGATISFQVAACGNPPLYYQWFFNDVRLVSGGRILGANTSNLSITNATTADAGYYQVVVHNPWGAVHSTTAQCVVVAPPAIVLQPQSQGACEGGNATFQVTATGTAPLSFQWRRDGVGLFDGVTSSPTNSSLTLTNLSSLDPAGFDVLVTNAFGQTNSATAYLYFPYPIPAFSLQPTNTLVPTGATLRLESQACGEPGPLTYQWYRGSLFLTNGSRITGADSHQLTISNASTSDTGDYQVVAMDASGLNFATSLLAKCYVGDPPGVGNLTSRVVRVRSNTIFNPTYGGTLPRAYQWYRNDVPIPGANGPTLSRTLVQRPAVGLYHVVVANGAGVAVSEKAHLQVRLTLEGTPVVFLEEATDILASLTNAVPSLFTPPATSVYHGVPLLFSTYGATTQSWELSHCTVPARHSMWVQYDATNAGPTRVSTEGSTFDTVVAVYTWSQDPYDNPTLVRCDNDGGYDRRSLLYFSATAGVTYYLAVDGVGGVTGIVRLAVGQTGDLRKLRFNPANGSFQFEWAGPFWKNNLLREATTLSPPISWAILANMPATNADWVIGYTNTAVLASPGRFYSAQELIP